MKRILSLFLAFMILQFSVGTTGFAAQKEDINILFSQTFNDITTHTRPDTGTFTAQETYVADVGKGEKQLVMRSDKDGFIKAEYTGLNISDVFGFTVELALASGKINGDISLITSGGKQFKPFNFTSNEGVKTHNGYRLGGLRKDKQRFTFIYDSNKAIYSIYIGDKGVVTDNYLTSSQLIKDITSVKLSIFPEGDSDVEVIIDDIYFYEGYKFFKDKELPKSLYNSESIAYESPDSESKESVYFIRDWEEPAKQPFHEMAKRIPGGSSATIDIVESEDGNHYMKWVDDNAGACFDAFLIYPSEYTGEEVADKRFIIAQMDISGDDLAQSSTAVLMEDGARTSLGLWATSGNDITAGNKIIGTLSKDKWTNVAAVCDMATKTTDLFVDYKEVASDIPYNIAEYGNPNMIRIYGNGGTVHFDNFACYSGKTPRPMRYDSYEAVSMIQADRADLSVLKRAEVLNTNSGRLYKNGEKIADNDNLYILNNGIPYVNIEEICKMYETKFTIDGDKANVNGVEISGIEVKNDIVYAPYDKVFEANGKKTYYDERGMIVAYTGTLDTKAYGNSRDYGLWDIFDYTNYDRPSPDEIVKLFNEKSAGVHPRLVHSKDDIAKVKEKIAKYDDIRAMYNRKIEIAENYLNAQPTEPQLNQAANNFTSRGQLTRFMSLGEAYLLTGDERFAQKLWVDIENILETWEDWYPFETLGYAATMSAVSFAYDWCYDYFTPEQRKLIEEKLYFEVLELGFDIHNGRADTNAREHLNGLHNRNAVIAGSYIVGCIALMDVYPEESAALLNQMLKQLEMFGRCFFPGGAYEEGSGYWTYGMQYFNRAVATLDLVFGDDFGLYSAPDIGDAPYWIVHGSSLTEPNNFHDGGSGSPAECMGDFGYMSQKLGDPGIEQIKRITLNRLNQEINDIWYSVSEEEDIGELLMDLDSYFPTIEQVNFRSAWGTDQATFFSAHAGFALPSHGHLDTGTFVFEMVGEKWAVELPSEDYAYKSDLALNSAYEEIQAFGIGYNANPLCYTTRPEGHNTIVINPDYNCGQSFQAFSPVTKFEAKDRGVYAVVDMTDCYREDATSAIRGYMLSDDRRGVVVRDEVTTVKPNSEVWWFMYTKADVEITDDKTAILTLNGKQIKMQLASSDPNAKIETGPAQALEGSPKYQYVSTEGYNKIFVRFAVPKDGYIQTRFIPVSDPKSDVPINDVAIKDWSIPDGEIVPLPYLDMIYRDGKPLEDFVSDGYAVNIKLAEGEAMPAITASANDDYEVTVTPSNTISDITNINVRLKADPTIFADYKISFEVIPKLSDYNGYERLAIFGISSNNIPQAENGPYNLIDESIQTRHAMNSMDNTWARFDLGSKTEIDAIAMAVYDGANRTNSFALEISDDGGSWKEIYSGISSGTTDQLEVYDFAPVSARYIRLVPKGCSAGSWYSTTEFYPMKKR